MTSSAWTSRADQSFIRLKPAIPSSPSAPPPITAATSSSKSSRAVAAGAADRIAGADDRGGVGEVEGRRPVPVRGDLGAAPARPGGDVALEGVEVADARRLRNRRQGSQRGEVVLLAGRLAALAAEEGEDVGGAQRGDAFALDDADEAVALGRLEASDSHPGELPRTRSSVAGRPNDRLRCGAAAG